MSLIEKRYKGVVVPMISPFHYDFSVDAEAAAQISDAISSSGAAPFLFGSTGEGPSMSLKQKEVLIHSVVQAVNKSTLVYAGISSNSLADAIDEGTLFARCGADVLVATLPYYYPVDEQQMTSFFEQLADKLPLPLILYNMPAMVKRSIPLEIAEKLSNHPNIVGMKDSERDEDRLMKSIDRWKGRKDFSFLIGWAAMSSKGLQAGADGIVPGTGNFSAGLYVSLYQAVKNGDYTNADKLQELTNQLSALYQKGRDLSHSIPALKQIMEIKALCQAQVLPPMYPMSKEEKEEFVSFIETEFKKLNL